MGCVCTHQVFVMYHSSLLHEFRPRYNIHFKVQVGFTCLCFHYGPDWYRVSLPTDRVQHTRYNINPQMINTLLLVRNYSNYYFRGDAKKIGLLNRAWRQALH